MKTSNPKRFALVRSLSAFCGVLFVLWFLGCVSAQETGLEAAEAELKAGKYQPAILSFTKLLQANANDGRAQRGILAAYLETGQYPEAEREAKKFANTPGNEAQSRVALGEVYAITGRYAEAIAEFEKSATAAQTLIEKIVEKEKQKKDQATDEEDPQLVSTRLAKLRADLHRAETLELTGKQEEAQQLYQTFVTYYEENDVEAADELTLVARALVHLEKHKDADSIYEEAQTADEKSIEAHLGSAELYTSKYNYEEASGFLEKAFAISPNHARAHLAVAANNRLGSQEKMNAALQQALKINPNYVQAKVFAATLDLEAERFPAAVKQLDETLKINPNSLDAHSLRAAMYWQQHRLPEYEAEVKTVQTINPRYAGLYETLGHFATQTRRYRESVAFLREAVKRSPNSWSSHLALGTGLLRLGEMEEGRAEIEAAFNGDPFNIWAKNTLDLLDVMKDYRETKTGDFILRIHPDENDVIARYASDLLAEAQAKLSARYKFTPRAPISVEIFPNSADFSVRALGLAGLGALGVCFGQVIAQDSPSARPGGEFNWGSTMWHEYMHVISLQGTDHLIPRWFSEGLSVFEEHKARPGWGDDWNPSHLKAFADGKWFKIADLDNGFIRPKKPEDVGLAYFEASQLCHFVEEKYGFNALLEMLRGYKEKKKTPEVIQAALKLSESEFDREFDAYLHNKVDKYIKAFEATWKTPPTGEVSKEDALKQAETLPDNFTAQIRAGAIHFSEKNFDQALPRLKRSIELFPFQSGPNNAYEMLLHIYEQRADKAAQAETLDALLKVDENNYRALKKLAQLKLDAGDKTRALELLKMSFYVNPFEHGAHTMAGNLHLERNEHEQAIREFQIAFAAKPPNVAEAHYNLARAYLAAGKRTEARKAILRSLEIAPSFDKAQDLLLQLIGQ